MDKKRCFSLSFHFLSSQRSSVRGVRCTRNVVVPVGAPVQTAGTAMMMEVLETWVIGCVSQVASVHQDWCKTIRASVFPSLCAPVCRETKRTSPGLLSETTVTPGKWFVRDWKQMHMMRKRKQTSQDSEAGISSNNKVNALKMRLMVDGYRLFTKNRATSVISDLCLSTAQLHYVMPLCFIWGQYVYYEYMLICFVVVLCGFVQANLYSTVLFSFFLPCK